MSPNNYNEIFQKIGLNQTQSEILELLIVEGEHKASYISRGIKKTRQAVYKEIEELIVLKLVKKNEKPGEIATFKANDPRNIEDFLEKKESEIIEKRSQLLNVKKRLGGFMPEILSNFNLSSGKPDVRFFDDEKGFVEMFFETLNAKSEILTISDAENLLKNPVIMKYADEYYKKRIALKIKKKVIVPEASRKRFKTTGDPYTKYRFLSEEYQNFNTNLQIFDDKIYMASYEKERYLTVIIQDKNVSSIMRTMYRFMWDNLKK